MNSAIKFLLILLVNVAYAQPIYAKNVKQKELNFEIQTEALMKGELHYAFELMNPSKVIEKFPEALDLDSLSTFHNKNIEVMITKTVSIVNQPVGFFDHENMKNEKYLSHIMGEQKIKQLNDNTFKITVLGASTHTYHIRTYFDSDDISTLPNSRTIQAVTSAKKLDVISQSASSVVFREYTNFSKYAIGGSKVSFYLPLKEDKTLMITYGLMAVSKEHANEKLLKKNFIEESEAVQLLINSYRP